MTLREAAFAALTLISAGLVVIGIAALSTPGAWIAAGILLAGWSWLALSETK